MSSDEIQIRQRVKEKESSEDEEEEKVVIRKKGKKTREQDVRPTKTQNAGDILKERKKKKKEESLTCSRLIAYLMISPTLIYVFTILYDVIKKYSFTGKFYHVVALLLGIMAVTSFCIYFYKSLQPYLKYMAALSLIVLFIPTIHVFNCSPVHFNNSDLGKMFKLREGAGNFMKLAYHQSVCWKNRSFKTPYALSLYTPRMKLTVKPYQVVNLMMHHFDQKDDTEDGPPPEGLPSELYLLTSQRSVKRQMYNLNLLTMSPGRLETLRGIMELGMDDRENVTLDIVGTVTDLGPKFDDTKKELEEMDYLLRPLLFTIQQIEVFGVPEEQTENLDEYEADRTKWKKKKSNEKQRP